MFCLQRGHPGDSREQNLSTSSFLVQNAITYIYAGRWKPSPPLHPSCGTSVEMHCWINAGNSVLRFLEINTGLGLQNFPSNVFYL